MFCRLSHCLLCCCFQVKCWGRNNKGQLGLGDTNSRGDGAGEMADSLQTVNLGAGRTAQAITTGDEHTCAILDNSQVECLGCANCYPIYALITSLVVALASCSARVAFEVSEICRVALSVPTVGMRILTCVSLHCLRNSS